MVTRKVLCSFSRLQRRCVNMTRALALEWARYGITVNAIGPGPTETPGLLDADTQTGDELQRDLAAHMPLGRRMQPEELVGAAVYLASPSASACEFSRIASP